MSKRGLFPVVMFLIYLIIMLPLCSSVGWANIISADVYGNDQVSGFRREQDDTYLVFNVTPASGEPFVNPNQLKVLEDMSMGFVCNIINNATKLYECKGLSSGYAIPGPINYNVQFTTLMGSSVGGPIPIQIIVDGEPPSIPSGDLVLAVTGNKIDVNYTVKDSAFPQGTFSVCSGIKRLRFTADDVLIYSEEIPSSGRCVLENSTNFTIVVDGTKNKTLCLEATDYVGQTTESCQEVTIDMSIPAATRLEFLKEGHELIYVRDEPVSNVELWVYITEDSGINVEDITADLSSLNENPTYAELYSDRNPDACPEQEVGYKCLWSGLLIYLTEDNPSINLTIKDVNGNKNNQIMQSGILVDSISPDVQGMTTGNVDPSGKVWAGIFDNTITASMVEEESGFNDRFLAIDFTSFGSQKVTIGSSSQTILRPNECSPSWTCTWRHIHVLNNDNFSSTEGIPLQNITSAEQLFEDTWLADVDGLKLTTSNESNYSLSEWTPPQIVFTEEVDIEAFNELLMTEAGISSGSLLPIHMIYPSSDDAGNIVEGKTTVGMFFDGTPPQIVEQSLTTRCPVAGEDWEWVLTVKDEHSGWPSVTYDPKEITLTGSMMSVPCEEGLEPGLWTCKVVVSNLPSFGIEDLDMTFWLKDLAGNTYESSYENYTGEDIKICEPAEGAPPNLIHVDDVEIISSAHTEDNKPAIDRKIASSIEFPLVLDVTLNWIGYPSTDNIEIIESNVESCFLVDVNGSVPYAEDMLDFNTSHPFIATGVLLGEDIINSDEDTEIELDCNLSFRVRKGTKIYNELEYDNIGPAMPDLYLTNSPIGYIDDNIQDKLDDITADIKDIQDTIDTLDAINLVFGIICTIGKFAVIITQVIVALKFVILVIATILEIFGAGGQLWGGVAPLLSTLEWILVEYIWNPPGYAITDESLGTVIRVMCSFYTCKLTEGFKLMRIVPMFGSAVGYVTGQSDGGGFTGSMTGGQNKYGWADNLNNDGFYDTSHANVSLDEEGETALVFNPEEGTIGFPEGGEWGGPEYDDSGAPSESELVASSFPIADMFTGFQWDAWRSVHNAWVTLCVPMLAYNYRKLKQIRCLEYRCVHNRGTAGFDIDICSKQRKMRECLYFDSAAHKLMGDAGYGFAQAARVMLGIFMNELLVASLAAGTTAACNTVCEQSSDSGSDTEGGSQEDAEAAEADSENMGGEVVGGILSDAGMGVSSGTGEDSASGNVGGATTSAAGGATGAAASGETNPWAIILMVLLPRPGSFVIGLIFNELNSQYASIFFEEDMSDDSQCIGDNIGMGWAGWVVCDLLLSITLGIDSGDWLFYENSWDPQEYFRKINSPNYCEGIGDLDSEDDDE